MILEKTTQELQGGIKDEDIWVSTLLPQQIPVSLGPCFLANWLSKYLLAMNERSVSPDSSKARSPIYPRRPPFLSDQLAGSNVGAETQGCFLLCAQTLNDLPMRKQRPREALGVWSFALRPSVEPSSTKSP